MTVPIYYSTPLLNESASIQVDSILLDEAGAVDLSILLSRGRNPAKRTIKVNLFTTRPL